MTLQPLMKWLSRAGLLLAAISLASCSTAATPPSPTQAALPASTSLPSATALAPTLASSLSPTAIPATPVPPTVAPSSPTPAPVDLSKLQVLNQLAMMDTHAGWALTQDGVLRTTDGGKTWGDVTPAALAGQGGPMDASFLDASSAALLAGNPQDPEHGSFSLTTDGGATWTSASAPFGMGHIQFLDRQHGFALASLEVGAGQNPVAVYRTDDAGQTWTLLFSHDPLQPAGADELPVGGIKSGLTFSDAAHGWIAGEEPVDGLVYLYGTADGGKTWTKANVKPAPGTEQGQFNTDPPRFFDAQNGVLVAQAYLPGDQGSTQKIIYTTSDGGVTWTPAAQLDAAGPVALTGATDWSAWVGTKLHVTHDGGKTWTDIQPIGLDGISLPATLDFSTPTEGWLISVETSYVRLFHTADGGQTWEKIAG